MKIPEVIYIETTNRCNAACIMCPHKLLKRPITDMTENIYSKVINDLSKVNLKNTQLFIHKEGEPLCDKNIIRRILFAKENTNAKIGMSTNAMLLDENMAQNILNSGLDTIYFSIDGVSAETYNRIRVNCNYYVVKKNITYFLKLRERLSSKIRVIMQMIIDADNIHEKENFIKLWDKYDVEFYLKKMHCYLDGGKSSFDKIDTSIQKSVCNDPFRLITVLCDGNVGCCCWDYNNEYCLGNVMENDLIELYNGEKINYMRQLQREKECYNLAPCNRCGRIFSNDRISDPEAN
ncbi:MAG: radical SAM protein [Ruminococcus sp.]|nr:radical SAM protein [Ruminococcus sp.]